MMTCQMPWFALQVQAKVNFCLRLCLAVILQCLNNPFF